MTVTLRMKLWDGGAMPRLTGKNYARLVRGFTRRYRMEVIRDLIFTRAVRRRAARAPWLIALGTATGALLGAAVALAVAPMRGQQLRHQLKERARTLMPMREAPGGLSHSGVESVQA